MLERKADLTPDKVRDILLATAQAISVPRAATSCSARGWPTPMARSRRKRRRWRPYRARLSASAPARANTAVSPCDGGGNLPLVSLAASPGDMMTASNLAENDGAARDAQRQNRRRHQYIRVSRPGRQAAAGIFRRRAYHDPHAERRVAQIFAMQRPGRARPLRRRHQARGQRPRRLDQSDRRRKGRRRADGGAADQRFRAAAARARISCSSPAASA